MYMCVDADGQIFARARFARLFTVAAGRNNTDEHHHNYHQSSVGSFGTLLDL